MNAEEKRIYHRDYQRAYRHYLKTTTPEQRRLRKLRKIEENRLNRKKRKRQWNIEHAAGIAEAKRLRRAANPEKHRRMAAEKYHRNKPAVLARNKKWASRNREHVYAYKRKWNRDHPGRYKSWPTTMDKNYGRQQRRKWKRNNPEANNRINRDIARRGVRRISDTYVRNHLNGKFKIQNPTPEQIRLCRKRIQIHRAQRALKLMAAAAILSGHSAGRPASNHSAT